MEWPPYLDEYEKLLIRMSTPRVMIDNAGCSNATRLTIDSARKHGILLEAIQVLTDLNLSIKKAYICSDGRWFMDVFHVTDLNGNKLTDESVLGCIEESLETVHYGRSKSIDGLTALELTGTDRVGLLSEVFAVLSNLHCNVVDAKVWTHNGRIASLIYLTDDDSGCSVEDSEKLEKMEGMLRNVLRGDNDIRSARTSVSLAVTHMERRLHQMMFADRDYDGNVCGDVPLVLVQNYLEKDYSVVSIHCKDRNKLLFDVVCTLTDMGYVVFHATVDTSGDRASLEFFIRHMDGTPINSEAEKQRVILCIVAAIKRRASQGVRLELCTVDKKGLLANVTRTFRENGLNVVRAEISTSMGTARNVFYVTDAMGNAADEKLIDSVRHKIGVSSLKVKELPSIYHDKGEREEAPAMTWSIGNMVRRNLYNLGLIKSCY
ncbi:ACT domain-containing protein ACR8-like [Salvia splendens]|uniref:ACT domain-containing protein ACR8-like n=1 Tax=Salvia splendens TaxID=180675 RepID=UPI001C2514C9|nr:ACT domain-containing protein ACR8-like [Salvia splendens]